MFSEPVQGASLSQVQVLEGGSPMTITQTLSNGNQFLTLTPNTLLAPNSAHSISITGVKDVAGNVLGGTVTITFTTGPGIILNPSLPAPTFSPAQGSTGQPVNVHPTLTYNQPVNPITTFNGGVQLVLNSTAAVVPSTFSISADSRTVTITPVSPLNNATQYTIRSGIAAVVTDQAGNNFNGGTAIFTTQ
jgi:hypothetical protein